MPPGYCAFAGPPGLGAPYIWQCKRQSIALNGLIADSTAHGELIALYMACCQALGVRQNFLEVGYPLQHPITLWEDNTTAQRHQTAELHQCTRTHLGVKYNVTRRSIETQAVAVKRVESAQQRADIFTKNIDDPEVFLRHRRTMLVAVTK